MFVPNLGFTSGVGLNILSTGREKVKARGGEEPGADSWYYWCREGMPSTWTGRVPIKYTRDISIISVWNS